MQNNLSKNKFKFRGDRFNRLAAKIISWIKSRSKARTTITLYFVALYLLSWRKVIAISGGVSVRRRTSPVFQALAVFTFLPRQKLFRPTNRHIEEIDLDQNLSLDLCSWRFLFITPLHGRILLAPLMSFFIFSGLFFFFLLSVLFFFNSAEEVMFLVDICLFVYLFVCWETK